MMLARSAGGNGGLLSRLHAWWEGYDDAGDGAPAATGAGRGQAPTAGLELDAEAAAGGGGIARLWTPERVGAVQLVCGKGCSTPGGIEFATSAIKPLGLNETMSVLVYGAQLGAFARAIAGETGAWVDGIEPEPLLAEAASQHSQASKLSKKAAIRAGGLAEAGIKNASRDAVVAVEALHRWPDRHAQLRDINRVLKSGGQLLAIDFVRKSQAPTTPAIDLWRAYEPAPPHIATADELRKALKAEQFQVRVSADITDDYCARLTQGLQGMAKQLIRHPPESAMHVALLREVHFWGRRLGVLHAGDVGVFHVIASRAVD